MKLSRIVILFMVVVSVACASSNSSDEFSDFESSFEESSDSSSESQEAQAETPEGSNGESPSPDDNFFADDSSEFESEIENEVAPENNIAGEGPVSEEADELDSFIDEPVAETADAGPQGELEQAPEGETPLDSGLETETASIEEAPADATVADDLDFEDSADIPSLAEEAPTDVPSDSDFVELNEDSEATPSNTEEVASSPNFDFPSESVIKVLNIEYLAKDFGKILISTSSPTPFSVKMNEELNQVIVEIDNVDLPARLRRPYSLQDFNSSIGALTAYQDSGSSKANIIVQLKDGAPIPAVQESPQGIVIDPTGTMTSLAKGTPASEQIPLGGQSLEEFLAGDPKYYGRPISLQVKNADVSDVINLIAEESGANIVQDGVEGKISLKLRQVPWDQALVLVMRTKRLGYTRQGNVLRVTSLDALQKETSEARKMRDERIAMEPLTSEVVPINYASVEEMATQLKAFLSPRGTAVGDKRTNTLVVTDTDQIVSNVKLLIKGLDITPPQVLIEAKIVEARDSFSSDLGVSWGPIGNPVSLGQTSAGPLSLTPRADSRFGPTGGGMLLGLNVGTFDFFGSLDLNLALSETEDKVKVVSSPRIQTLHNREATIVQQTEIPINNAIALPGGGTQDNVQFRPVKLELKVKPLVTTDKTIILDVNVVREFLGVATLGQPPINSRSANTQVLVGDGKTAVIGGIYTSDAVDGESGVPYFRDLPFVGWLFRGRTNRADKTELLVFLTPRVIQHEGGTRMSSAK